MGYIVRASSEREPNNLAFCAFNNNKSGWCVADGISENFWIEITCPEPVLIHKCSIKGLYGRIYDWKLQGNIGDEFHTWTDLYSSSMMMFILINHHCLLLTFFHPLNTQNIESM